MSRSIHDRRDCFQAELDFVRLKRKRQGEVSATAASAATDRVVASTPDGVDHDGDALSELLAVVVVQGASQCRAHDYVVESEHIHYPKARQA